MKENKCFKLVQHFGASKRKPYEWENVIAVSHDIEKLQKALKAVNCNGWKVLSDSEAKRPWLVEGDYYSIFEVTYL